MSADTEALNLASEAEWLDRYGIAGDAGPVIGRRLREAAAALRAAEARIKALTDEDAPMADEADQMTAAEEVLAWLAVEFASGDDGMPLTPKRAGEMIASVIREARAALSPAPEEGKK